MKDKGENSDGYHTFNELYKHRNILFIALCKKSDNVWKSKIHSDKSYYKDYFILGINKDKGKQITYHLPLELWNNCNFAETLEKAPEFDGHTPNAVMERLKEE